MSEQTSTVRELLKKGHIYLILFFLSLLALDLVFRYTYNLTALTAFGDWEPTCYTLCWCVFWTGIAWLLPAVATRIFMPLVTLFYSVLLLVHCGMISFFGKYFSFSDVQFAGDGAAFFSLEYIYIRKIIIAVVIVSFLVSLLAAFLVPKSRYAWWRILASVVMIALSVTGISRITANITKGAFLSWDNYMRKDAIYENFTDTNECMMLTGLYQYTFRDFFLSYGIQYRFFDFNDTVSALDAYYAGAEVDPDNEMTGAFVGKNLILIQLEAIDTWMINDICMPTLTSIQENSLDFTNYYAPMYLAAGTFNTENIVNTGLVSPFTGALNSIYTRNYYPFSLAHLMRSAGYSANSFHSQRGQVYDRETIHLNWGYETFYSGAAMGMADLELDSDMMSGYDLMVSPDHNFLTFIVTYSGHGAYLDSEVSRMYYDKFAELLPADTDEMVIYAYAHAYETDLFIKALMERLEADGYLENTVLAFYSDHYNYYVLDDAIIMDQKQVYDTNLIQHTAFFIYSQDTAPQKITKVTSTLDVLPTLANLFDLDTDGRYYTGNDAFSDGGGYVIFKNYSWYDGETYWNYTTDPEDSPEIAARNEEIAARLKISWDTMKSDYFQISGAWKQTDAVK